MAKSLIEMVADIVTAQASQGPMSVESIELMIEKTFLAFKVIREEEDERFKQCATTRTSETHGAEGSLEIGVMAMELEEDLTGEMKPDSQASAPSRPDINPMKSIGEDRVSCLECGQKFRQLSHTHLKSHGLTPKEYRKKYGFSARQPLTARTLSEKRKLRAKEINLGGRLKEAREEKRKG